MTKKNKKSVVGLEKIKTGEKGILKEVESYTIFGVLIFLVGILFGVISSGVSMNNDNEDPADLDSKRMIVAPAEEKDEGVTTDDLDVEDLTEVKGDSFVEEEYKVIYPE